MKTKAFKWGGTIQERILMKLHSNLSLNKSAELSFWERETPQCTYSAIPSELCFCDPIFCLLIPPNYYFSKTLCSATHTDEVIIAAHFTHAYAQSSKWCS